MNKTKIKEAFYREFIAGQVKTDWIFLIVGLLIQTVAIIYTCLNPGEMTSSVIFWTSVSGLTGIISVVLCAQGKISFYIFGFIQLFSYVFAVAIPEKLWGEVGENVFYFVTMLVGMIIWWKHYKINEDGSSAVKSKKLDPGGWTVTLVTLLISTVALALFLTQFTSDPLPWFDSITTTAPFIAQIFLMLGYRDQWFFWAIEDILSLGMFIILGNWIMVAQYLFWTANTFYGWIKWTKENKKREIEICKM